MKILKLFFFLIGTTFSFAQNVILDPNFGNVGNLVTEVSSVYGSDIRNLVVTADNKFISVGVIGLVNNNSLRIRLARHFSNGVLDISYGNNGIVDTFLCNYESAFSSILQPDGKLLVGGRYTDDTTIGALLIRYNANGSLDTTFGVNGVVKIPFTDNYVEDVREFLTISLFSDNKILVSGTSDQRFLNSVITYSKLLKFNTNGTLDTSFGVNGKLLLNFPSSNVNMNYCVDTAILPDDTILCSGYISDGSTNQAVVIAKLNTDGSVFSSFGANGLKIIDTTANVFEACFKMIVNNNGSIYLSGASNVGFIIKLLPNSDFDNSFGTNGIASHPFSTQFFDFQDDKIAIASLYNASAPANTNSGYRFRRLNSDGSLDLSFNQPSNLFLADFNPYFQYISGCKVVNNKIIAFGSVRLDSNTGKSNFFMTRLLTDQNLNVNQNSILNTTPKLYPNPNNGIVNFVFKNETDVIIYDVLGQKVFSQIGITANTIVQTNLKKGFYFVNYSDKFGEKGTLKMVVE